MAKRKTDPHAEVSFERTREEDELMTKIAQRALGGCLSGCDLMEVEMDICATHANGCPLKLAELLAAEDFDFSHDMLGIRRHLNRETGKLEDCFLPRYAAR